MYDNAKRGILLKDDVYLPDHNDFDKMREELGIDTKGNWEEKCVIFTLFFARNDVFTPLDEWTLLILNQDDVPDWYKEGEGKTRIMEAARTWAKSKIYVGTDGLALTEGAGYHLKECVNVSISNAEIATLTDCIVNTMTTGSVIVNMDGKSSVNIMEKDSAVRRMSGNSFINLMRGASRIFYMFGHSFVRTMCGKSTVEAMSGNSTILEMRNRSIVENMYEDSCIHKMLRSSTVNHMHNRSSIKTMKGDSLVKQMSGGTVFLMEETSTVNEMCSQSEVREMRGRSIINEMKDSATAAVSACYSEESKYIPAELSDSAIIRDFRTKTLYHSGSWELAVSGKKESKTCCIYINAESEGLLQVLKANVNRNLVLHWRCESCNDEQVTDAQPYTIEDIDELENDEDRLVCIISCMRCNSKQLVYQNDIKMVELL